MLHGTMRGWMILGIPASDVDKAVISKTLEVIATSRMESGTYSAMREVPQS
jgi:hypothetical protein